MKSFKAIPYVAILFLLFFTSCEEDEMSNQVVIDSFEPSSAESGDTLIVQGSNFKEPQTTVVYFADEIIGKVIKTTPNELEVIVPEGAEDGPIQVRVGKTNNNISEEDFILIPSPPKISSLSPSQGLPGSSLTIIGTHLSNSLSISDTLRDREAVQVYFGDVLAEIDSVYSKRLWLKVPEGLTEGEVDVRVERDDLLSNIMKFTIGNPPLKDEFNRESTLWIEDSEDNSIGDSWEILNGQWRIVDPNGDGPDNNFLEGIATVSENILIVNTSTQTNTGGFLISSDVNVPALDNSVLAGIAFHAQDNGNYYAFRLGGGGMVQLIKVVDGVPAGVFTDDASYANQLQGNSTYNIEISSEEPYNFNVKVFSSGGELIAELNLFDEQESFEDGFGGLYSNSAGRFDNFTLLSR